MTEELKAKRGPHLKTCWAAGCRVRIANTVEADFRGETVRLCRNHLVELGANEIRDAQAVEAPAAPTAPTEWGETIVLPAEQTQDRAQGYANLAQDTLSVLDNFTVESPEDLALLAEVMKQVRDANAEATASRDEVTKPLNAVVKRVRSWFKPGLDSLAAVEARIKQMIREGKLKLDAKADALLEEASKARAAGNDEVAALALDARATAEVTSTPGVVYAEVWKFEITDPMEVPREFLTVAESRIRAHVMREKGNAEIPGVRVFKDVSVRAAASK